MRRFLILFVVFCAFALAFFVGVKCGENSVILHQRIDTSEFDDCGYIVEYNGQIYCYD